MNGKPWISLPEVSGCQENPRHCTGDETSSHNTLAVYWPEINLINSCKSICITRASIANIGSKRFRTALQKRPVVAGTVDGILAGAVESHAFAALLRKNLDTLAQAFGTTKPASSLVIGWRRAVARRRTATGRVDFGLVESAVTASRDHRLPLGGFLFQQAPSDK
jgi:hypothetical protein